MAVLGISLYPEKTSFEEDQYYLLLAKKYRFSRLFLNLLFFETKNVESLIERIKETIREARNLDFEVFIDVNPFTLEALGVQPDDLGYFSDLGVNGIRLDMGFTGKEEARMTHNPYGLKIEINMSNDDHYLERIFDYNPNRNQLIGCHNFFPQKFTGLAKDYFMHCSKRFLSKGLRTAAFVTSQEGKIGPWPLHEGLCTIEAHRHLPIEAQVKELKALNVVEDIIIGNAYASEAELKIMSEVFFQDVFSLQVELFGPISSVERDVIEANVHTYRGDRSPYMIRSSLPRFIYRNESLLPQRANRPIHPGDVLILNQEYAQYKGELQLALEERPGDPRVNVVGQIAESDRALLYALKPYTEFKLTIHHDKFV